MLTVSEEAYKISCARSRVSAARIRNYGSMGAPTDLHAVALVPIEAGGEKEEVGLKLDQIRQDAAPERVPEHYL